MEMNNKELFEIIEKAVNGDIKAKFEIIIIFESLIKSKAYIKGKFNQECKEYIEDRLFDTIENFKAIKEIKKFLK